MSNNKKVTAKELIRNSLEEMKKVFENDTEEFLNDVNLIQQLNTNESLKSVKLQEKLECMVKDSQEIRDSNAALSEINSQLTELENQTDNMQAITKELDEWTKELAIKSRRMKK
ncbi:hypothetical protein DASC09_056160 [Saccharomycopsis crataegensis]|uniref:Uncharacterized protein n=1 Tax=Saccharomycopsis crataegensis TaxID=43959 RepID=A0AAV5QTQ8_9ASCO|nr:hypothetical protein DASC09_056160 [Saccharomycopsis crataegensis]